MNPLKCGCNVLGCVASSCLLWVLVAFIGQWLVLGLTPRDTDFYPVAVALTYSSYVIGAVFIATVAFAIYHYQRQRARPRFEPLTYGLDSV